MRQLTDIHTIRRTLDACGFHFSRLRGQNFLVDSSVPERMAALFDKDQAVLEIGPGFGALTAGLCARAGSVTAVEVDARLLPVLQENLRGFQNLTLTEGDALHIDLPPLLPPGMKAAVCANLPYSVTTPLLTRFLETSRFDPIVVMIQREVAERITAAPGTSEYGAFTLFCGTHAQSERLFDVPPECFFPRPKVVSSVIRLTRHICPPIPEGYEKTVARLYRAAFAQRRKTLANALSSGTELSKPDIIKALENAHIDPSARGETLSLEDYIRLATHCRDLKML